MLSANAAHLAGSELTHRGEDRRDQRTEINEAIQLGVHQDHGHADGTEVLLIWQILIHREEYVEFSSRSARVRRDGLRVPSSESHLVPVRIPALELSPPLEAELAPLVTVLGPLNEQIADADRRLAALAQSDPIVARLATVPGIGPVTASAVAATIDDITRFPSTHPLEAYCGVVPSEQSSGEKRRLGRSTTAGNRRVRWLLVEAAWWILRSRSPETAALRAWTLTIAQRRGKRIAVVALARRLAGIRHAMWRDGGPYDAGKIRSLRPDLVYTG